MYKHIFVKEIPVIQKVETIITPEQVYHAPEDATLNAIKNAGFEVIDFRPIKEGDTYWLAVSGGHHISSYDYPKDARFIIKKAAAPLVGDLSNHVGKTMKIRSPSGITYLAFFCSIKNGFYAINMDGGNWIDEPKRIAKYTIIN